MIIVWRVLLDSSMAFGLSIVIYNAEVKTKFVLTDEIIDYLNDPLQKHMTE